jgi:hypothetical protein
MLAAAALAAALPLAGCGGGSSSGSASAGSGNGSGSTPGPVFELGAFQDLVSPSGDAAITNLSDVMVIGDHAVLRSDSATTTGNELTGIQHVGTRFSLVDGQGKVTSSIDYGMTLAGGYGGGWVMLPTANGFALLQAAEGAKLFQFDAQAKPVAPAAGISLYALPTGATAPAISSNAAAVDGNGIWVATTLAYPQTDGSKQYRLNLTKIDWNGKALTPTAPLWTSTRAMVPRIAASAGAVAVTWRDGGSPMLALWSQGGGVPVMKGLGAGGGSTDFRPLALNGAGRLGLFWGIQSDHSGNLGGIAFNAAGAPVMSPGGSSDAWDSENLSGSWGGTRRTSDYDLRVAGSTLYVADVIDDPKAPGDTIVLADYTLSDAAVASATPRLARTLRAVTAKPVPYGAVFRQLVFADHTVLLLSDTRHTEASVVTRR